jgi:sugar phosphate isomerase/epimerase
MRLGISSYTYTWAVGVPGCAPATPLGVEGLLQRAVALGVGVVQIADNIPLIHLPEPERERLATRAQVLGLQLEVGTRAVATEHLLAYLRVAHLMGSRILRVVTDTVEHKPSKREVMSLLDAVLPSFERANVIISIENHDRFTAREFIDIITTLASPHVGICLDTANSFGALEGPAMVVQELAPFTVNLHLKDFAIARLHHQMGFVIEGRPAGQGRLDVPWLLAQLRNAGSDPNVILELWTPPARNIAETIAKEALWAEQSIRYLRGLIPD